MISTTENISKHKRAEDDSPRTPRGSRTIRVCYVIDRLNRAGTELHLLRLIRGLDRSRFEPHLCLLDGRDDVSDSLLPSNCSTLRLGVKSLLRPGTVSAAWRFMRFVRRHQFDIVQLYYPDSTRFAAPLARMAAVPHILRTRRNLGYWMKPSDRLLGRLCGPLFSATVVCGNACRQAVIQQERAQPATIVNIPIGVDCSRFDSVASIDSRRDAPVRTVGMVANLRTVKGIDIFIQAAARIAASCGDVRFEIAGGGDAVPWRAMADEYGLGNRLTFAGALADIPAFLSGVDIAVLASRSEGMPNVVLEYMAAGRPIVATEAGGCSDLITHEEHGLLVPLEDPASLANAVARLLANRDLASRYAAAAHLRVRREFAADLEVCRYQELYEHLTSVSAST